MDLSPFFLQINVFIDEKTIKEMEDFFWTTLLVLAAVIAYICVCACV